MISDDVNTQEIRANIAFNVKYLREIRGLSVIEAATQLGVGRQYWYLIEKADANLTLDKLGGVAKILGVSIEQLVRAPKPRDRDKSA